MPLVQAQVLEVHQRLEVPQQLAVEELYLEVVEAALEGGASFGGGPAFGSGSTFGGSGVFGGGGSGGGIFGAVSGDTTSQSAGFAG